VTAIFNRLRELTLEAAAGLHGMGRVAMTGRTAMLYRSSLGAIAWAALVVSTASAQTFDYSKYPNLKGQWERFVVRGVPGQPSFDQTKGWGPSQGAPLTSEYRKIMEDSIADQATGGHGANVDHARCGAAGMPRMMLALRPLEFVVTPEVTYIIIADFDPLRRIFTDGRDWPKDSEPTYAGYSIGRWIDEKGTELRGRHGGTCFDCGRGRGVARPS
jgi:hypothetical protein